MDLERREPLYYQRPWGVLRMTPMEGSPSNKMEIPADGVRPWPRTTAQYFSNHEQPCLYMYTYICINIYTYIPILKTHSWNPLGRHVSNSLGFTSSHGSYLPMGITIPSQVPGPKVYPLPDFGLNMAEALIFVTKIQLDHLIVKKIPKKDRWNRSPVQKIDRPSLANSDSGAHLLRSSEVRAGVRHHLLILVECYTCQSISITLWETYKKLWKITIFIHF